MSLTKNGKYGIAAVVAVALVAGGAAYAATTFHGKSSAETRGGFGFPGAGMGYGGPGGFVPGGGSRRAFQGRPDDFGGGPFGDLSAAASYLGVSQSSLLQSLRSGKTLAQIASSTSGKSTSGLVDALVASEQTRIDAAVKAGRLTQTQADRLTADLKTRVTAMVDGTRRGGFGHDGFGGPPSQSGGTTGKPTHI